jgi:predicted aconitase
MKTLYDASSGDRTASASFRLNKPHGALTLKKTARGKVRGCFYALIDEDNLAFVQQFAHRENERESTFCNRVLNMVLTHYREEEEKLLQKSSTPTPASTCAPSPPTTKPVPMLTKVSKMLGW